MNKTPPASPPTTASDTRERIIDVAARMFFEKGYVRSATRHIAAEADVSEVTLFRHFGNKLSLFEAVMEKHSGVPAAKKLFHEELTGDFVDDLHRIARHIITSVVAENDALHVLMLDAQNEPDVQAIMKHKMHERRELFETYFNDLMANGQLRAGLETETVMQGFVGMCFNIGMSALWAARRGEPVSDAVMEQRINQIVDIFLNGAQ